MSEANNIVIGDILKTEDIYIQNSIKSRKQALKFCSERIYPKIKDLFSYKVFFDKIVETDKTNIILPSGFYMPHIKIQEIDDILSVLSIFPQGIKDEDSGITFYIVFLFLSPLKPTFFQKHLNILSFLARTFNQNNVADICKLNEPAKIFSYLQNLK